VNKKNLRIIQLYLNKDFLFHFQLEAISSVKNPAFEPILFLNHRAIELYGLNQKS